MLSSWPGEAPVDSALAKLAGVVSHGTADGRALVQASPAIDRRNLMRTGTHDARGNDRILWLDTARGICIILVVMVHFYSVYFEYLHVAPLSKKLFDAAVSVWRPARMPTFFFISGFLASGALMRPWAQVVVGRVYRLYWVYLLWSIVATLTLFVLFERLSVESLRHFLDQISIQLVFARQSTWFLYGLILFFIAARCLRDHPRSFIAAAVIGSAFSEHVGDLVLSEMIRTLPYFLTGIYYPRLLTAAAGRPSLLRIGALLVAYVCAVVPVVIDRSLPGVWLPSSILGVTLILSIARALPMSGVVEPLRYVGRNTLPIYVLHVPILLVLRERTPLDISFGLPLDILYGAGVITMLVIFCLAIGALSTKIGLGMLFDLPARLTVDRRAQVA